MMRQAVARTRRKGAVATRPPRCRRCGAAMRLFGIEAHPTIEETAVRTYVCDPCDTLETATTVNTRKKANAPGFSPFANKAFDDQMTARLGEAYETAWRALETSGSPLAGASQAASTRERLAKCILEIGRRGETDSNQLAERALVRLAGFSSAAARPSGL